MSKINLERKLWDYPVGAWAALWGCMVAFPIITYFVFPATLEGWKGWLGYGIINGFVWGFSLYATIYQIRLHRSKKK